MAFIEVSSVSKSLSGRGGVRPVLDGVDLTVEEGEFVSIVGSMGCGKSTLLSVIAGLTPADAGMIRFAGARTEGIRSDVAIVFQSYSLLPWFSALENVRLAVGAAFPDWTRARHLDQARRYLEKVGLSGALERRPSQLSGGMRQRVAIARALATEPSVLLLDEPFGALDALTRATLQQELVQLCNGDRRMTTIMITNSLDEALLLSDRIVPMTRAPRARLGTPVAVRIPKPRTLDQLMHDEHAILARTEIVESLTASMDHVRRNRRTQARNDAAAFEAPMTAALGGSDA